MVKDQASKPIRQALAKTTWLLMMNINIKRCGVTLTTSHPSTLCCWYSFTFTGCLAASLHRLVALVRESCSLSTTLRRLSWSLSWAILCKQRHDLLFSDGVAVWSTAMLLQKNEVRASYIQNLPQRWLGITMLMMLMNTIPPYHWHHHLTDISSDKDTTVIFLNSDNNTIFAGFLFATSPPEDLYLVTSISWRYH